VQELTVVSGFGIEQFVYQSLRVSIEVKETGFLIFLVFWARLQELRQTLAMLTGRDFLDLEI